MTGKSGKKYIIIIPAAIFLLAASVILAALIPATREFLSISSKVDANVLVIEGWLPRDYFEMAYKEFTNNNYDLILTTGIKSPDLDFCQVAMNGYLIFYPGLKNIPPGPLEKHSIEVLAHSEMGGKYATHFSVFINDSLITAFTADEKKRKYGITWNKPLAAIDSVMICFDNDYVDSLGDRNLYIKNLIIDEIIIPYQFNSVFDAGKIDSKNRVVNNYSSIAEVARNILIGLGVPPSMVIAVPGERTRVNRTLASVVALSGWLKTSGKEIRGINIVSRGIHSRRTWVTYKNILNKSYRIGIISLPESSDKIHGNKKFDDLAIEILSYLYYRIILIPSGLFN